MNDVPTDLTEGNPEPISVDYAAKKRRVVLMLLAYSAVAGVIIYFLPEEDNPLDFVVSLPFLLLGILWCHADAGERDHPIGLLTKLLLVLMFVVGFPLHLFQTRGLRGFKTLFLTMLLVAGLFACMALSFVATLFAGEATGLW